MLRDHLEGWETEGGDGVHPPKPSHGNVWQRPAQCGKAIILQFKKRERIKNHRSGKTSNPKEN